MLLPVLPNGFLDYELAVDPLSVRPVAAGIVATLPGQGFWTMPQALLLFHCVRALAYVSDPIGLNHYVQEPAATLEVGGGNCEAKSILLCSMLRAVGITSRMVVLVNGSQGHMLTEFYIGTYDLFGLSRDLSNAGAPAWLRRRYAGVASRQFGERDSAGFVWLIADPCYSEFAGDIDALMAERFLYRNGAGTPWSTPPVYFSDGSSRSAASAAGEGW